MRNALVKAKPKDTSPLTSQAVFSDLDIQRQAGLLLFGTTLSGVPNSKAFCVIVSLVCNLLQHFILLLSTSIHSHIVS